MTGITETEPRVQIELAESELGALFSLLHFRREVIRGNAIFLAATEPLYQKLKFHLVELDPDFNDDWQIFLEMVEKLGFE